MAPGRALGRSVIEGIVTDHFPMPRKSFDHVLHLDELPFDAHTKSNLGHFRLYYRLPSEGELPARPGDRLRLRYYSRPSATDTPVGLGFILERPGGEVLALVNVDGAIPVLELPVFLHNVRRGNALIYQESGTFEDGCQQVREHKDILLGRSGALVPGNETVVTSPGGRYLVVLFDNMEVAQAEKGCKPAVESWWGYGALWLDRNAPRVKLPRPVPDPKPDRGAPATDHAVDPDAPD